jgi:hypothetical protein
LEAALAESVLENRMLTATLEVASQALAMDLKKNFRQGIIVGPAADGWASKQATCGWFGISRQAYYQACRRQQQWAAEDQLLLELV